MNRECRGVSNVVGVVLLVATVLGAVTLLAGISTQTMSDGTDAIAGETTETDLEAVAESAETVAYSGQSTLRVDLRGASRLRENHLGVTEDGHMTIAIGSDTDGWRTLLDADLGTLAVEGDHQTLAYQGGGIYRTRAESPDAVEVLRAPPIAVRSRTATAMTLSVFRISGDTSLSGQARFSLRDQQPVYDAIYVPEDEQVRITVTSQFAAGWAETFERSVPAGHRTLTHDADTDTVTLTYGEGRSDGLYLHSTAHHVTIEDS